MAALNRVKRALAEAMQALRVWLPDRIDVHLYGGVALVAAGAWMYSPPAGYISLGAGLWAVLFYVNRRPE